MPKDTRDAMLSELIGIHTTTDSLDHARALAHRVVAQGWGACVQIETVQSVYPWAGQVQEATEYRLLIKTQRHLFEAVCQLIRSLHHYELPAIWTVPLDSVSPDYAQWVREHSTPADAPPAP